MPALVRYMIRNQKEVWRMTMNKELIAIIGSFLFVCLLFFFCAWYLL
jgi:hypothetical protein